MDEDSNLEAENLKEALNTELLDEIKKDLIDERHNAGNEANESGNNVEAKDAGQQLGNEVEDVAQERKEFTLDRDGNNLEDELDELKHDRKDIAEELSQTAEIQQTSDGLQDGAAIEIDELLDSLDGPFENFHDLVEDFGQDFGGALALDVGDFIDDLLNNDDDLMDNIFQTVVFTGVLARVRTPQDINIYVGVDIDEAGVLVGALAGVLAGVRTPEDIDVHVGIDIDKVTVWQGSSEGEDTEGEDGKSGESERTHCRWLMNVGKRVTGGARGEQRRRRHRGRGW